MILPVGETITDDSTTNEMESAGAVDPITSYEAFHTESIWFGISGRQSFAETSIIQAVFAFDVEGNVTVYNNAEQFKFSISNNSMSDNVILAIIKDVEMEARAVKDIYIEPQRQPVNLQVFTDDPENITQEEILKHTDDGSVLNGVPIKRDLVTDPFVQPVYDMQFLGCTTLKTRITDSATVHTGFNLNAATTEGVHGK